ncbi:hypothetical protein BP5796_08670 [Coleophoma crateriformis]|uniref:Uncharacterized protein n=1 Tax=Coleophoma crateriformis TaxID=565419 RepID=A0A3D8R8A1_9HELO|nr:hypothetical protein BP5796_08670 [Coleophoma crateriformis]
MAEDVASGPPGNMIPESEMVFDPNFGASTANPATLDQDNPIPSFIQNQIALRRAPSSAQPTASRAIGQNVSVRSTPGPELIRSRSTNSTGSPGLMRNQSIRSNGSVGSNASGLDAKLNASAVLGVRLNDEEGESSDQAREELISGPGEATRNCKLSKSSSTSTVRSVRSVAAVGTHPIGTLRVHYHSPERSATGETFLGLKSGDIVLISGMKPGCIFAYDIKHFTLGEKDSFEGLKEVPPGPHFFWGGSSHTSTRTGVWLMSAKRGSDEFGETHVLRWDEFEETLIDEVSLAETRNRRQDVPNLYPALVPYENASLVHPQPGVLREDLQPGLGSNLWTRLTNCVKGALLSKITGKEWNHWQVSSSHDYKLTNPTAVAEMSIHQVLNFVFPESSRTFSSTSIGRERTEQAMDTSAHVAAVIQGLCTYEDPDEIVGELQFCYVTGMSLGNAACMEHWGHMVRTLFRAYSLILDMPTFILKVINALHAQMIYDEVFDGSIFDSEPKLEDDLKIILTTFKSRLNELLLSQGNKLTFEQESVGKAFEELESWLWKWNWDLRGNYVRTGKIQLEDGEMVDMDLKDFEAEDERGEYAPQIVDLDEDGLQKDLIRF